MNGRDPDPWQGRGALLLTLARAALRERFSQAPADPTLEQGLQGEEWLLVPGATFVTLRLERQLRGCIGSVQAIRPLIADLRANAVAAALEDPRFPPLRSDELDQTAIEVTLLDAPRRLAVGSEADALLRLRPHLDGVLLHWRGCRATLLPQVWHSLPDPAAFLRCLKAKAGLDADFWDAELELYTYTARSFCDPDP